MWPNARNLAHYVRTQNTTSVANSEFVLRYVFPSSQSWLATANGKWQNGTQQSIRSRIWKLKETPSGFQQPLMRPGLNLFNLIWSMFSMKQLSFCFRRMEDLNGLNGEIGLSCAPGIEPNSTRLSGFEVCTQSQPCVSVEQSITTSHDMVRNERAHKDLQHLAINDVGMECCRLSLNKALGMNALLLLQTWNFHTTQTTLFHKPPSKQTMAQLHDFFTIHHPPPQHHSSFITRAEMSDKSWQQPLYEAFVKERQAPRGREEQVQDSEEDTKTKETSQQSQHNKEQHVQPSSNKAKENDSPPKDEEDVIFGGRGKEYTKALKKSRDEYAMNLQGRGWGGVKHNENSIQYNPDAEWKPAGEAEDEEAIGRDGSRDGGEGEGLVVLYGSLLPFYSHARSLDAMLAFYLLLRLFIVAPSTTYAPSAVYLYLSYRSAFNLVQRREGVFNADARRWKGRVAPVHDWYAIDEVLLYPQAAWAPPYSSVFCISAESYSPLPSGLAVAAVLKDALISSGAERLAIKLAETARERNSVLKQCALDWRDGCERFVGAWNAPGRLSTAGSACDHIATLARRADAGSLRSSSPGKRHMRATDANVCDGINDRLDHDWTRGAPEQRSNRPKDFDLGRNKDPECYEEADGGSVIAVGDVLNTRWKNEGRRAAWPRNENELPELLEMNQYYTREQRYDQTRRAEVVLRVGAGNGYQQGPDCAKHLLPLNEFAQEQNSNRGVSRALGAVRWLLYIRCPHGESQTGYIPVTTAARLLRHGQSCRLGKTKRSDAMEALLRNVSIVCSGSLESGRDYDAHLTASQHSLLSILSSVRTQHFLPNAPVAAEDPATVEKANGCLRVLPSSVGPSSGENKTARSSLRNSLLFFFGSGNQARGTYKLDHNTPRFD
ncbi:uncharacterized protein MYCFIDRAFT_177491 [Pseudocercospora fijiensis CIRAD86]|uniref:Uncharacterized protein n=1 Tax=Pseudocercospora fijiensis (strain CIRAD86) TaxID=383855 RepID=M2ZN69_PSEFD|nr:uncharacterized protein MYCFIDRAFT_177491 [Pseudocercospora fijiensis CIRAD86]EME80549.1 hypothetical protein MYCFIDRAFT_177491 [Pseudocercospora fijiensis CIRAD86]